MALGTHCFLHKKVWFGNQTMLIYLPGIRVMFALMKLLYAEHAKHVRSAVSGLKLTTGSRWLRHSHHLIIQLLYTSSRRMCDRESSTSDVIWRATSSSAGQKLKLIEEAAFTLLLISPISHYIACRKAKKTYVAWTQLSGSIHFANLHKNNQIN